MLFLIILSILFFASGFYYCTFKGTDSIFIGVGTLVLGIFISFALFLLPMNRMEYLAEVQEFHQTEKTVAVVRESIDNLELMALSNKIIDWNNWLASAKFYNDSFLDIYVPDVVNKLQPIK